MVKVSVVVPVYNAEQYLDECVSSLIHQTVKEIELIFVDDGSTDNSVKILERYQKEDGRIIIIKQENQYAGVARNNGMKVATGKYIIFLDADDFFVNTMLEELFDFAENNKAEITIFGHYNYDHISNTVLSETQPVECPINTVFSPKDVEDHIFEFCWGVPWNKLLLKSFIDGTKLEYQHLSSCNDEYFNKTILVLASRLYCLNKSYVYYRINTQTSLQAKRKSKDSKEYNCFALAFIKIKKDIISKELFSPQIKESFNRCLEANIDAAISYASKDIVVLNKLYIFLKEKLVPSLFDNVSEMDLDHVAYRIFISISFEQFLFGEIEIKKKQNEDLMNDIHALNHDIAVLNGELRKLNDYVNAYNEVVNSRSYRLGRKLLILPRKMKERLNKNKTACNKIINQDLTIIAQNCIGGVIYSDHHMAFRSPTVNMFIEGENFIKLVENLEYYLSLPAEPVNDCFVDLRDPVYRYPKIKIGDIELCCQHYANCAEAIEDWERRKQRVNFDRVFVIGNSWNLFENEELIRRLCQSKYPTICFTFEHYDIPGCIQLKGNFWKKDHRNIVRPNLTDYIPDSRKRYYEDQFDIIKWLNSK